MTAHDLCGPVGRQGHAGCAVATRSSSRSDVLVALNVTGGADGSYSLYEDDGRSTAGSATTAVRYTESDHVLRIDPARGTFSGRPADRQWTALFTGATMPTTVRINGAPASTANWKYDADRRTLTVMAPTRSVRAATTISYR